MIEDAKLISEYRCPRFRELPQISLYMDQVLLVLTDALAPFSQLTDPITSTMINNYVKQKLISPPENKKYSRTHVAELIMIFILKRELAISEITSLLSYIKEGRSAEAAYDLFCERMEAVIKLTFGAAPALTDAGCPALDAALTALANKLLMQFLLQKQA